MNKFTFIDLFAGIGAFRIALESCGGQCVFSSEFNKAAQETYQTNYGDVPFGDITLEETKSYIPDNFDVLCGGFPCQPFSKCGKQKGFEDTRGTLFFDICQILEKKKPKLVILENVKNIINHDSGNTFKVILKSLESLGYQVSYSVLNAKDFGLPQNRERLFIVCSLYKKFDFSKLKYKEPVMLKDFLDDTGDFEYLTENEYTLLDSEQINKNTKSGLIFCGYRNKNIRKTGVKPENLHHSRTHRQTNRIYSVDGSYATLTSQETAGRYFIYNPENNKVRKLTINECYRILGFPDDFKKHKSKSERYRQIGNSIAIPIISEIIVEIIKQGLL